MLQLSDSVTFATMNVFGRDLSGTAKVQELGGRDQFGNHAVMVLIGKNVVPGVTGGTAPIVGTVYGATGIDSATGASMPSGGDIARPNTGVAAAKRLGAALGIDQAVLAPNFVDNGKIKPVKATVASVT